MDSSPHSEVTRYLAELGEGDEDAASRLFPLVYEELRGLASSYLNKERRNHTLQPTALVHEAFLRLCGHDGVQPRDRNHFLALAARAMRRILIDHARARQTAKRGGKAAKLSLEIDVEDPQLDRDDYLVALDEALEKLTAFDERKGRLVELRFFGGLTIEETAQVLGVGHATVERDWSMAKAWLHRAISEGEDDDEPEQAGPPLDG